MVRGNWQKRVETADARRREARQRKHAQEDRRRRKQWAHEALALLDNEHSPRDRDGDPRGRRLQLWTDVPPADDDGDDLELEREIRVHSSSSSKQRKKRSTSTGGGDAEELLLLGQGGRASRGVAGRARSNSHPAEAPSSGRHAKKKVHPRSKQQAAVEDHHPSGEAVEVEYHHMSSSSSSAQQPRWLCRSFFFTGQCDELASRGSGRKSGGCRHVHNNNNSLGQVVLRSTSSTAARAQLERAERAVVQAAEHQQEEGELLAPPVGAMEMVYSLELDLSSLAETTKTNDDDDDDPPAEILLSERVTEILAQKHLKLANVVFMCLDNVLVFDRYREGLIYTDGNSKERSVLAAVLLGEDAVGGVRPKESVGNWDDNGKDENEHGITTSASPPAGALRDIPGTTLEHILTFLPDEAVASASRVCRAWHHEIGQNSPNLWRQLLDRRGWPHPPKHIPNEPSSDAQEETSPSEYRSQFLLHYSVCRDLAAVQLALGAIADPRTAVAEKEMAYQDFSIRKHAPVAHRCVDLCEWSPNRLLVAYAEDCSLRLYETSAKPPGHNSSSTSHRGEKTCREIICQRVDPYQNTKRRSCVLLSMGLDEQCVGCLCKVVGKSTALNVSAFVLVVISREDFLLGESTESTLNVIDVGEAVLNYLLSSDDGDHRLLELVDFLSEGNNVGDVEVNVSRRLAACGYGRFMVEASISIPVEGNGGITDLHMIDRKLFLFSATIGAIVWMGESSALSEGPRPAQDEMILTYLRRPQQAGGSRPACFLAVSCGSSPAITVGEIEASGEVPRFELLGATHVVRNEILEGPGWEIRGNSSTGLRPIVVTNTDIVVADTAVQMVQEKIQAHKTIVSFYPRYTTPGEPSYSKLTITGGLEVVRMSCLRDQYVILVCRRMELPSAPAGEGDALDEINGHWFGNNAPANEDSATASSARVVFVVVHVPTRREIHRMGVNAGVVVPQFVDDGSETVGVSIPSPLGGLVMTGDDVRCTADDTGLVVLDDTPTRSSKKKKKRQPNKGGKKDGFARGMSLRG